MPVVNWNSIIQSANWNPVIHTGSKLEFYHSVGKLKSCDSVAKLKMFCHSANWNPEIQTLVEFQFTEWITESRFDLPTESQDSNLPLSHRISIYRLNNTFEFTKYQNFNLPTWAIGKLKVLVQLFMTTSSTGKLICTVGKLILCW